MMEEKFTPDGWLGLLLGSKLRISFINPASIESDVNTLIRHIGSKCLVKEELIVPVQEIPLVENPGKNNGQQTGLYPTEYYVMIFCIKITGNISGHQSLVLLYVLFAHSLV